MTEQIIIALASFLIAGIGLYSGFGLATLLMPIFALFFPLSTSIAATAIVHLVTNIFKLTLFYKNINWSIVARFGIPALITSFLGSLLLTNISQNVFVLEKVIGLLIIAFALFEIIPVLRKIKIDQKWLVVGGSLSGFFGGLSGHQGALRSVFLLKTKTSTNSFIATGVVIAIMVDIARLFVYGTNILSLSTIRNANLESGLIVAIGASLLGVVVANNFKKKITLNFVRNLVAGLMLLIGVLILLGII
jgi:uncharacterized membrane protein YfcA